MSAGLLERWALFTSRKPWLCIAVVLIISLSSVASIAMFGVTQSFNVRQFEPDSEIVRALDTIGEEFPSDKMVTVLVDFNWNPQTGNLRKDQFLAVLQLEKSIFEDESINPLLRDPLDFRRSIYSPVSGMVLAFMNVITAPNSSVSMDWQSWGLEMVPDLDPVTGEQLLDPVTSEPLFVPAQTYDNLIITVQNLFTVHLHQAIYLLMAEGSGISQSARDGLLGLMSNDFYYLTSTGVNATAALIMIHYSPSGDIEEIPQLQIEQQVKNLTSAVEDDSVRFYVVGWGLVNEEISNSAIENLQALFPLALLFIFILLYVFLRDIRDVLVTVFALLMAIIWIYGYAALAGEVLTPLSLAVPFLILGIGTDFSIHLIIRFRQERENGLDKEASSVHTMRIVGQALILSTLTTCVAYLSNITSDMQGMIQFGVMNTIGLLAAFVIIMLLVPSYLSLRSKPTASNGKVYGSGFLEKVLTRTAGLVFKKGKVIVMVVAVITLGMGMAAVNMQVDFDAYEFLPQGSEIGFAVNHLNDNFQSTGIYELNLIVKGEASDPVLLSTLQESIGRMATVENVVLYGGEAATRSMFGIWHDRAYFSGPGDLSFNLTFQELYADYFIFNETSSVFMGATEVQLQEMLAVLYDNESAAHDLSRYISTGDNNYVRMVLVIEDKLSEAEMRTLEANLYQALAPMAEEGYELTLTGDSLVSYEIVDVMREAQLRSVALTLGSATIILSIIGLLRHRSYVAGLMMVIPTSITIVWLWGISYMVGVTMNPLTMTVAAITVGVGVDYAIHMADRFYDLMDSGSEAYVAILETITHTGKGVLGGAVTTAVGFGILGFFSMKPIAEFGILAMFAILFSLIITLLFLSSMLVLWGRKRFTS